MRQGRAGRSKQAGLSRQIRVSRFEWRDKKDKDLKKHVKVG